MVSYILTKFSADWLIFVDARVQTKSDSAIFQNSRANDSGYFGSICPIIDLIRDLMGIYIVAKFGTDWSYLQMLDFKQSNMANFLIQGHITQTVLVR